MQDCSAELVLPPTQPHAFTETLEICTACTICEILISPILHGIKKKKMEYCESVIAFSIGCIFFPISFAPVYPHHSTDSFHSWLASRVLTRSLRGLFYHSFLNKATQNIYGKRNITTVPLTLPKRVFPNWFTRQFLRTSQI